ncbi:hypothetical protein DPMN_162530 [Dreissena polymorpha]|uniref:CCHC-type domain-containing protein n=1 Tax=Dreissena polymorpha TaxID=45954 RepID=A0A9D4EU94_DREPO|nr:hypothetical protein DPMN_162530 [Dreissena polymorpha]
MSEGIFSEDQILYGLRRALRGKASEHLRRAGVGLTLDVAVRKLEQEFGCIKNVDFLFQKFYSIEQKASDDISTYCARLEDLYELIVKQGGCSKDNTEILKRVLYKGLKKELKQMAGYKFDTVQDYDKFKMELRIIETEIKSPEPDHKKCHAAVKIEKNTYEEILKKLSKTEELLMTLNERIDQLEQTKEPTDSDRQYDQEYSHGICYRGGYRGNSGGRWNSGRGRGNNSGARGRGVYKPHRPTGTGTMQPTCFRCNEKGHIVRNCPKLTI